MDRGTGERVITDRDVAGGRAGDRRQRVVADGDIARARGRQGVGAGAGHGGRADGDVVGASRDVETGLIADCRVRAGGGLVQRLIADRRVVGGRAREQGQGAVADGRVIARTRHGIGAGALHGDVADRGVVGRGRGPFHGVHADRRVRIRGVDRGTGQRVVADCNVAGRPARDRGQRVVADGDVARARCGQGIGAGADHGARADRNVVSAGRAISSSVIAQRCVRTGGCPLERRFADCRTVVACGV